MQIEPSWGSQESEEANAAALSDAELLRKYASEVRDFTNAVHAGGDVLTAFRRLTRIQDPEDFPRLMDLLQNLIDQEEQDATTP